jgi:hypothetical protein
VAAGSVPELVAAVRNPGAETVAMPMVVVPVPPGFGADRDSLDQLRRSGEVSKVEDLGSSIAIYLLELAPGQRVRLRYRLEARAECDVLQRPAVAYAYYSPEVRGQSASRRLGGGAPRAAQPPGDDKVATMPTRSRHTSPAQPVRW